MLVSCVRGEAVLNLVTGRCMFGRLWPHLFSQDSKLPPCIATELQKTYLGQHGLCILEVAKHSFNVSFVGRPGKETPGEPLHALHRAGQQQLRAMLQTRVRGWSASDDAPKDCQGGAGSDCARCGCVN